MEIRKILLAFAGGFLLLSIAQTSRADLIDDVRMRIAGNSFAAADAELRDYKARNGATPEYVEALSWMARGEAAAKQWDQAAAYARETRTLCEQQLAKRKLDAEPHLPIALGAAYEVLAQEMAANGRQQSAIALLRTALAKYGTTSIGPRLQKNMNVLALVGRKAPAIEETQYLGPKPVALTALKGSPVLLFFWAHWCGDCKAEVPVIARLRQEFGPKGLVVIGPTTALWIRGAGCGRSAGGGAELHRGGAAEVLCEPPGYAGAIEQTEFQELWSEHDADPGSGESRGAGGDVSSGRDDV